MAGMVSASRDGGVAGGGSWNVSACEPVRGSSQPARPQALLEMATWAERGYDLAITPDGPRGPRYVVQEGVMSLAQITGLPIVPVSYHLELENPVEKLGPFSDSAAVRALRSHRRPNHARAARGDRCRTRGIAPTTRSRTARHHAGLNCRRDELASLSAFESAGSVGSCTRPSEIGFGSPSLTLNAQPSTLDSA